MGNLMPAKHQTAYDKVNIYGFTGSGKTYTASLFAVGYAKMIKENRVATFETEPGTDFLLQKIFGQNGIQLVRRPTRTKSLADLVDDTKECIASGIHVLLIDSISHVWEEFVDAYDRKFNRNGKMQFQDWKVIKGEWKRQWVDLFLNSPLHIICCGRSKYSYKTGTDEKGNKEVVADDTVMSVEKTFGHECFLLIEMERMTGNKAELEKLKTKAQRQGFTPDIGAADYQIAHIIKDRADMLHGQSFPSPTFDNIMPHVNALNIGGQHLAYDASVTPEAMFPKGDVGPGEHQLRASQKEEAIELIMNYREEIYPGMSADSKQSRTWLAESAFGNSSKVHVTENVPLEQLQFAVEVFDLIRKNLSKWENLPEIIKGTPKERVFSLYEYAKKNLLEEKQRNAAGNTNEDEDIPLIKAQTPLPSSLDAPGSKQPPLDMEWAELCMLFNKLSPKAQKAILNDYKIDSLNSVDDEGMIRALKAEIRSKIPYAGKDKLL